MRLANAFTWTNQDETYQPIRSFADLVARRPIIVFFPAMVYVPLATLSSAALRSSVDVLGVVRSWKPCSTFKSKDGKQCTKRDIVLGDASGAEVRVTLWDEHAQLPDANFQAAAIVSVSSAKVGEFQGRCLSSTGYSVVRFWRADEGNDDPHVAALRTWVRQQPVASALPSSLALQSLARKQIATARGTPPPVGARPEWCAIKATVLSVRSERAWYPGCAQCAKKVVEDAAGKWVCTPCGQRADRPRYRYVLNVVLADASGSYTVTLFDDAAHALLGMSADEAEEMHAASPAKFRAAVSTPEFAACVFEVSVKQEARDERTMQKGKVVMVTKVHVRMSASRVGALNFPAECTRLLAALR